MADSFRYVVILDDLASLLVDAKYVWWDRWQKEPTYSREWREATSNSRYLTRFTKEEYYTLMPQHIIQTTYLSTVSLEEPPLTIPPNKHVGGENND